jgi:hypothetical protein
MHKIGIDKFQWDHQVGILSTHYTNLGLTPYDMLPNNIDVVGNYAVISFRIYSRGKYVYNGVNQITDQIAFATHARFYDVQLILEGL